MSLRMNLRNTGGSEAHPQLGVTLLFVLGLVALDLAAGTSTSLATEGDGPIDYTEYSLSELLEMDVVYGASKHEQKTMDAPSSITVLTAEEIKAYGWQTLAEILKSLRGFYLTYDRNYNYLGARGFGRPGDYNSRILVLIDGNRINENVYDSAQIGNDFPLAMDLIERIEVVRGPSSSIYGTSAIFGIVNVVTKAGHQIDGIWAQGELGSFGTSRGYLTAGGRTADNWDWLVSGALGLREGQDHSFAEFDGVFRSGDREDWQHVQAKVSHGGFCVSSLLSWQDKHVPTAPWGTLFGDSRTMTTDNVSLFSGWYQGRPRDDTEIMARLTYGSYRYRGTWIYDLAEEGQPVAAAATGDLACGRWLNAETQVTRHFPAGHLLAAGAEIRNNLEQDQGVWAEDPFYSYLDDHRRSTTWAGYLMLECRLAAWLRADLGVRHDRYETFGGTTNPRLALVARPTDRTVLKALYGSAFRAPNMYELYFHDSYGKQNPTLHPETIRTLELVWDQTLSPDVHGLLSGFLYRNRDLIEQEEDPQDGLLIFRNAGEVQAQGMEAEITGRFPSGWRGRLSYSFQDAKYTADDSRLTNSPRHMLKGNAMVPLRGPNLLAGLEIQYVSPRLTYQGRSSGDYVLTNLTVTWEWARTGLEMQGSVQNLFDREYTHPGGVEHLQDLLAQDGRSLRLAVKLGR